MKKYEIDRAGSLYGCDDNLQQSIRLNCKDNDIEVFDADMSEPDLHTSVPADVFFHELKRRLAIIRKIVHNV